MAEATIISQGETFIPGVEVAQLTLSDGETYVCKRLGRISAAVVSGNEDNDAHINVTWSGATATVNYAGMTDQKVTLILFGTP